MLLACLLIKKSHKCALLIMLKVLFFSLALSQTNVVLHFITVVSSLLKMKVPPKTGTFLFTSIFLRAKNNA